MHEETYRDAAKHAEDPCGVSVAHSASILVGTHIQSLVQSAFDAPVSSLCQLPLSRVQSFRFPTGEQILQVTLVSQSSSEDNHALCCGWEAGLLRVDGGGAEGADSSPASIFLRSGVRPLWRQRLWRGKKAAPLWAAVVSKFCATFSDWL